MLQLREREAADYATNNMPPSFPHGLDCESFTIQALTEAASTTKDPHDREHVSPWLRRTEHLKRVNLSSGNPALAAHRWTLDYPEDLQFFRAVVPLLPKHRAARTQEILTVLNANPEISRINAHRRMV